MILQLQDANLLTNQCLIAGQVTYITCCLHNTQHCYQARFSVYFDVHESCFMYAHRYFIRIIRFMHSTMYSVRNMWSSQETLRAVAWHVWIMYSTRTCIEFEFEFELPIPSLVCSWMIKSQEHFSCRFHSKSRWQFGAVNHLYVVIVGRKV